MKKRKKKKSANGILNKIDQILHFKAYHNTFLRIEIKKKIKFVV